MGGDHKCPVCQATFTRPQHVARHMRSHTGDRPYKCQYCGDQFARSDLLSRHINKCHANEKPIPTTGTRRKGTASASRATTSKQACDQCVASSLPCDGCNPCSKCMQRKCKCTFVKYHRQTQPAGPGHQPPINPSAVPLPSSALASNPRLQGMYSQSRADDFILGPAPPLGAGIGVGSSSAAAGGGIPTMADALFGSSQGFSFSQLYPEDNSSLGALAGHHHASQHHNNQQHQQQHQQQQGVVSAEYAAKYAYRPSGQSDTRAGSGGYSLSAAVVGGAGAGTGGGGLYAHAPPSDQMRPNTASSSASSSSWNGNAGSGYGHAAGNNGSSEHQQQQQNDKDLQAELANHYGHITHSQAHHQQHPSLHNHNHPGGGSSGSSTSAAAYLAYYQQQRRPSADNSDGSSVPSSAASSNVHLPLVRDVQGRIHLQQQHGGYANSATITDLDEYGAHSGDQHHQHPSRSRSGSRDARYDEGYAQRYEGDNNNNNNALTGEGGFSSAFGLMSLDDPNVLAGLANDSAPFFSANDPTTAGMFGMGMRMADPDATPMQDDLLHQRQLQQHQRSSSALALPTPSREADTKELRDFWKQYMRTPLSGPGPSAMDAAGGGAVATTMTPGFRRPRVASLPSAKTPILEKDRYNMAPQQPQNNSSSIRTTIHGDEDLRSYEAAVLARKAPTNLNFQPKAIRRSGVGSANTSPMVNSLKPAGMKFNFAPPPPPARQAGTASGSGNNSVTHSRPASAASSASSSLANAFGQAPPPPPEQKQQQQRVSFAGGGGNVSSRESSLAAEDHDHASPSSGGSDHDAGGGVSFRPSFKRLASQTLGPPDAKRNRAYNELGDTDDDDDGDAGGEDDGLFGDGGFNQQQQQSQPPPPPPQQHQYRLEDLNRRPMIAMNGSSIAERRRRMSAPTSASPPAPISFGFAPAAQGAMN